MKPFSNTDWHRQGRWVPVSNKSGERIPPFAPMRATGITRVTAIGQDHYDVQKPNGDSAQAIVFNGPQGIYTGKDGSCQGQDRFVARWDTTGSAPQAGEIWGVESGKFSLVKGGIGSFICVGGVVSTPEPVAHFMQAPPEGHKFFEMKATVEEKANDFAVSGLAYCLEWGGSDWQRTANEDTETVYGDRFLHGVAFGDDDITDAGDRVICVFDNESNQWWIVEGGQTAIEVTITESGGIDLGNTGSALLTTDNGRTFTITVKALLNSLDESSTALAVWDDAGGGHWDAFSTGAEGLGCGLERDDNDDIAVKPSDLAGPGLIPMNFEGDSDFDATTCMLMVDVGCGLSLEVTSADTKVTVNNVDLAGPGLSPYGECGLTVDFQNLCDTVPEWNGSDQISFVLGIKAEAGSASGLDCLVKIPVTECNPDSGTPA